MIPYFKDNEMKNSGIVYNSIMEQIKMIYEDNPELAGELAISAIELVLTGDVSSTNMMIKCMLEPMKKINEVNQEKYERKIESTKNKAIVDQKLDQIAALYNEGLPQKLIGERLGLSQQMVSYRMGVIRTKYPELLQNNLCSLQNDVCNTKKGICEDQEQNQSSGKFRF